LPAPDAVYSLQLLLPEDSVATTKARRSIRILLRLRRHSTPAAKRRL